MTDSITALIFGPSLPAGGSAGVLQLRSTGVEVVLPEQTLRAPLTSLQLRTIGFGKQQGIELAFEQQGVLWAVHVLDPAMAAQLLASPLIATLPQAQALKSSKRRVSTGRALGWSLLGLFALLPFILLLLLFLQADRLAGWVIDRIPVTEEVKLGQSSFASMKPTLSFIDQGAAYDAVQSIGKRLAQGSVYKYEFHVVRDDTLNAFALPGGIVVVHDGLIKATQRPEELAGVLAHEVQHVEQRHSLKAIVKNLGFSAVWAWVSGDLGGTLAGQAALQLGSLKFSRDAETQADNKGFDRLIAQGIDPSGMPDFFKVMSKKAADAPVAFISSHPLSVDRQAALAERVKALQGKTFAPIAITPWPPIAASVP